MKIMTGKTGTPHVTSQQFRQLVEGTVGQESYILSSGEKLEPELQTNNLLKIRSGMMSHHGNLSVVDIGTYDEVTIQNGTQGMQRIDLVVNRYTRNEETGIEDNEWIVIMGTPAASDPVAPAYTEGNLQEGDLVDDCPVFKVHLDGINVTEVEKLLSVTPDIPTLNAVSVIESADNYRKWADGTLEVWGETSLSAIPITSHTGILYNSSMLTEDFPVDFTEPPEVNVDFANAGGAFVALRDTYNTYFTYYLYADAAQSRSGKLCWKATGKWK